MPHVKGELDVSTKVLLEGPELVLKDPTSSLTGMALSGMLAAQVALQVSMPLVISSSATQKVHPMGTWMVICVTRVHTIILKYQKQLTFNCVQLVLIHEHGQNILP